MEENIKEAEVFAVRNVDGPFDVVNKDEVDHIKEELMAKILGENVSIAVGNYIFIPPLANPEVTTPDRTFAVIQQDNYQDGYVRTPITVDGQPMNLMTHISRIVHEGQPYSVSVIPVDKFSEQDLKIAFKDEFPPLFAQTVGLLMEHKKSLEYKG